MQFLVRAQILSNRLHRTAFGRPIARLMMLSFRVVFGCYLPPEARIAPSVQLWHNALGLVVNKSAVIEDGSRIGVHVVIGGKEPLPGAPHLCRNVTVHSGAVLIGPITIGEGATIGANAVVLKDVEPGCTVVGVPAKAVRWK